MVVGPLAHIRHRRRASERVQAGEIQVCNARSKPCTSLPHGSDIFTCSRILQRNEVCSTLVAALLYAKMWRESRFSVVFVGVGSVATSPEIRLRNVGRCSCRRCCARCGHGGCRRDPRRRADSEPKRARRTQVETAEALVQKWREALEKSSSMVVQLQAKGQLNATDARKLKVNLEKIAAQGIAGRELFASALARRGRLKGWRSRHSLRCAINPTST